MKTSEQIKVRACSIMCKSHLEWGTWGVMEDKGDFFEIRRPGGGRVLFKSEADADWIVIKHALAVPPKKRSSYNVSIIDENETTYTLFADGLGTFTRPKNAVTLVK